MTNSKRIRRLSPLALPWFKDPETAPSQNRTAQMVQRMGSMWRTRIALYLPQIAAVFVWIGLILAVYIYLQLTKLTLEEAIKKLELLMITRWYGPVIFFALFLFRPFTLVPAIVFVALGGRIFGLWMGFVYGLTAMTISSVLPYYAGRLFAGQINKTRQLGGARRVSQFVRANPFEALLALRLVNVVYDIVSFVSGSLRVSLRVFLAATLLGNLSVAYTFAALGASLEGDIFDGELSFNGDMLFSSAVVFVISLGISRYLRSDVARRSAGRMVDEDA